MQKARIDIYKNNLISNYRYYQNKYQMPIIGVVKANAYGHDALLVSQILVDAGITMLAVSTIEEGIALRKQGINVNILILGSLQKRDYNYAQLYGFDIALNTIEDIEEYMESGCLVHSHLKINTGMNRLGIDRSDFEYIKMLLDTKRLLLAGIFTHYSKKNDTKEENLRFSEAISYLRLRNVLIHTGEAENISTWANAIRIGIGLYGISNNPKLLPVMALRSPYTQKRMVKEGEAVSYFGISKVPANGFIYILPLGYGDGWLNFVLPILSVDEMVMSPICMDYTIIFSKKDYPADFFFEIIGTDKKIVEYATKYQISEYLIPTLLNARLKRLQCLSKFS